MIKLILLIISFFKELKVIKSINKLNRKLKTSFSYYLVLEEIDFLKAIKIEVDNPTMKRYEHLNNVSLLWLDGIKEELLYKYKKHQIKYRSNQLINDLFNNFKDKLIKYLQFNKILSKTIYLNKTIEDDDIYLSSFIKFDLKDIENYKYLILNAKSIIDEIKVNYKDNIEQFNSKIKYTKKNIYKYIVGHLKSKYNDEYYTFDKIIYFGPTTLNFNNEYIDKENFKDYKKYKLKHFKHQRIFFFKHSLNERIKLFNLDNNLYRLNQIDGELNRLSNFEELILNNNYIDFYFDTFLWRILNDLLYLSIKLTGGLKKIIEDLSKNKIKGISRYSPERTLEALIQIDDFDLIKDPIKPIIKENDKAVKNMNKLIKDQIIIKELENEEKVLKNTYEDKVLVKDERTLKK